MKAQILADESSTTPGESEEAQTRATVDNVRAILEDAGSSLEKILDVTVYLTDMKRDFNSFNRVYAELLGTIQPTSTITLSEDGSEYHADTVAQVYDAAGNFVRTAHLSAVGRRL